MTNVKDTIDAAVASAAVTSWAWLPTLESFSTIAALLLPIVGVVWLTVQIMSKFKETTWRRRR